MTLRVVAVDDEPLALRRLELALMCVPGVELAGACGDGRTAVEIVRSLKPDILVLDVRMPGLGGFEVVKSLRDLHPLPEIIFLTAFEEHAVRAFDVRAADYLVKPVAFERLREALKTAAARIGARDADHRFARLERLLEQARLDAAGTPDPWLREFWVKERDGLVRLSVDDVERFEASGDYVVAHACEREHLLRESISGLAARLDPARFIRVHRSAIVSAPHVRRVARKSRRGLAVVMASGAQVGLGPSFADGALAVLKAERWR